jgi:hypothetical protein
MHQCINHLVQNNFPSKYFEEKLFGADSSSKESSSPTRVHSLNISYPA